MGGDFHYQYDIQLEIRLVGIFHSPMQHISFSWLVCFVLGLFVWFFFLLLLSESLQLKIFVRRDHLSKSFIMDLLRSE